jgi:hypothetical protein
MLACYTNIGGIDGIGGHPRGSRYVRRRHLRFDNYPNHPGVDRHHYHTPTGVNDDIEYTGLKAHVQQFYNEMDDRRER